MCVCMYMCVCVYMYVCLYVCTDPLSSTNFIFHVLEIIMVAFVPLLRVHLSALTWHIFSLFSKLKNISWSEISLIGAINLIFLDMRPFPIFPGYKSEFLNNEFLEWNYLVKSYAFFNICDTLTNCPVETAAPIPLDAHISTAVFDFKNS